MVLESGSVSKAIEGKVFVLGDNIDTDQIIPAQYLNLVPTIPDEYRKLGSYALAGLPEGGPFFIEDSRDRTVYPIIVAGRNFGCGSSREHAPIALGAAGVKAVVAESYARIFFRNAVSTGELYPIESLESLDGCFSTGDTARIDLEKLSMVNLSSGKSYEVKPLGEMQPVIEAGGLFEYARKTGMIAKRPAPGK